MYLINTKQHLCYIYVTFMSYGIYIVEREIIAQMEVK